MTIDSTHPNDRRHSDRRRFEAASMVRAFVANFAVRRGDVTKAIEISMSFSMLLGAFLLVCAPAVPPLPFPLFFGYALAAIGLMGLWGVGSGDGDARIRFAFCGIVIRCWMCLIYLMRDWHDPAWVSLAMGTVAMMWILRRLQLGRGQEWGCDE